MLKQLRATKNNKYPKDLRAFALTLNFYSPNAYRYVRHAFQGILPHPATLRKWYSSVSGSPGFTAESFQIIEQQVHQFKLNNEELFLGIQLDEISIRQHIDWHCGKAIGYINNGYDLDNDAFPEARDVLVFLAVAVNSNFKLPIAYLFVNGLGGNQRAILIKKCLQKLNEVGASIV